MPPVKASFKLANVCFGQLPSRAENITARLPPPHADELMQPLDEHLFRESALGIDELNPEARHLQVAGTSTGRRAEGGEGAQLSPTRRRFWGAPKVRSRIKPKPRRLFLKSGC